MFAPSVQHAPSGSQGQMINQGQSISFRTIPAGAPPNNRISVSNSLSSGSQPQRLRAKPVPQPFPMSSFMEPTQPSSSPLSSSFVGSPPPKQAQVLKSRIVSDAHSRGSSFREQPRMLYPEGGDLGPQVSRCTYKQNGLAKSESKPSLAAFTSTRTSSRPAPSELHRLAPSEPQRAVTDPVWTGMERTEVNEVRRSESRVDRRQSFEDDELPTLRELVKVGTAAATSSTASASRQTLGSSLKTSPTWLGMGVGQPGRSQRQEQLIIALDVDEVLVRYVDGFRKYMQKERPNGPLDTDSIFHEAHNPNSPWRLQFALSGGLDNLEAVPGAAAGLQRFRALGVRLEAVTSRPPIMRQSTEALLSKLFPPDTFAAYHFVGPGEKGRTCNAIGASAIVDDQFPNCVDCCSCGVVSILFDYCGSYPWSQNLPEFPPNCKRCETWAETCNYILARFGVESNESKPSDYLVAVKQAVANGNNHVTDYRDALSEAGKQPTEYEFDTDAPPTHDHQRSQAVPLRSEPWWQMRDEPSAAVQSAPRATPISPWDENRYSRHDDAPHSEPWWQMRDEPPPLIKNNLSYANKPHLSGQPKEYGNMRPQYQLSQTSPNLQHETRISDARNNGTHYGDRYQSQSAQAYGGLPYATGVPASSMNVGFGGRETLHERIDELRNHHQKQQAFVDNRARDNFIYENVGPPPPKQQEEEALCVIT